MERIGKAGADAAGRSALVIEEIADLVEKNEPESPSGRITPEHIEREYIGASSIGHPCERMIALRLRGFPTDPIRPSLKRIFEAGHLFERLVVDHLEECVSYFDEYVVTDTGAGIEEQHTYYYYGGACRAHSDGVLLHKKSDEKTLIEIKSANDTSFGSFVRLGLKYSHQSYYDQMQLMMGLGEMKHGLMIMINKNNSQMHTEVIEFDEVIFGYLTARVEYVASGKDEKYGKDANNPVCNMCSYTHACHDPIEIDRSERTCRHCAYSIITPGDYAYCNNDDVLEVSAILERDEAHRNARTCPYFTDYRGKK
jgi:hypothetical protein